MQQEVGKKKSHHVIIEGNVGILSLLQLQHESLERMEGGLKRSLHASPHHLTFEAYSSVMFSSSNSTGAAASL